MLCNTALLLMYFKHSNSPSLSPLVTTSLLSVSVCFSFAIYICLYYFLIPHTNGIIQYLSFSVPFISLIIVFSRSIHVTSNGRISFFLWLSNGLLCVQTHTHIYIYTVSSICICLLRDTYVASIS